MWQKQQPLRFLSLFYFSKMISAFVKNIMARSIHQVENLFISLHVFSESSKSCNFSTVLILLLLTMVSEQPYLLQTNSSFPLRLPGSQAMFHFVKFRSRNLNIKRCICSLINHAVSANQSARYMKILLLSATRARIFCVLLT